MYVILNDGPVSLYWRTVDVETILQAARADNPTPDRIRKSMESFDNQDAADKAYWQIIQAMTPEQKLRTAHGLYETAREVKAAALRQFHPDWSEEQVLTTVREVFLNART